MCLVINTIRESKDGDIGLVGDGTSDGLATQWKRGVIVELTPILRSIS